MQSETDIQLQLYSLLITLVSVRGAGSPCAKLTDWPSLTDMKHVSMLNFQKEIVKLFLQR